MGRLTRAPAVRAMFGCAALLVVMSTTPALGSRPASVDETAAITALYSNVPACSTVVISTVDASYARWDYAAPYPTSCPQDRGDGFGVAHQDAAGSWRDVYQGSDGTDACPLAHLPTGVGVELKVCRRPSTRTYLATFDRPPRVRPSVLPQGAHGAFERLRWRGWGKPSARATGVLFYSDRNETFQLRVIVTASRLTYCQARHTYLRYTIRAARTRDRQRARFATGVFNQDCASGL